MCRILILADIRPMGYKFSYCGILFKSILGRCVICDFEILKKNIILKSNSNPGQDEFDKVKNWQCKSQELKIK